MNDKKLLVVSFNSMEELFPDCTYQESGGILFVVADKSELEHIAIYAPGRWDFAKIIDGEP